MSNILCLYDGKRMVLRNPPSHWLDWPNPWFLMPLKTAFTSYFGAFISNELRLGKGSNETYFIDIKVGYDADAWTRAQWVYLGIYRRSIAPS